MPELLAAGSPDCGTSAGDTNGGAGGFPALLRAVFTDATALSVAPVFDAAPTVPSVPTATAAPVVPAAPTLPVPPTVFAAPEVSPAPALLEALGPGEGEEFQPGEDIPGEPAQDPPQGILLFAELPQTVPVALLVLPLVGGTPSGNPAASAVRSVPPELVRPAASAGTQWNSAPADAAPEQGLNLLDAAHDAPSAAAPPRAQVRAEVGGGLSVRPSEGAFMGSIAIAMKLTAASPLNLSRPSPAHLAVEPFNAPVAMEVRPASPREGAASTVAEPAAADFGPPAGAPPGAETVDRSQPAIREAGPVLESENPVPEQRVGSGPPKGGDEARDTGSRRPPAGALEVEPQRDRAEGPRIELPLQPKVLGEVRAPAIHPPPGGIVARPGVAAGAAPEHWTRTRTSDSIAAEEPANRIQPPATEIRLRLGDSRAEDVSVQVLERNGQLRVAVRTPDAKLASSLSENLPGLVNHLSRRGYQAAETWTPVGLTAIRTAHPAPPDAGTPADSGYSPRGGGGSGTQDEPGGHERREQGARPAWLEEIERSAAQGAEQKEDERWDRLLRR